MAGRCGSGTPGYGGFGKAPQACSALILGTIVAFSDSGLEGLGLRLSTGAFKVQVLNPVLEPMNTRRS